ncbi:cellulase family glycosylhydrolase [Flavihumibacter sp. CACIAM 22H1]|uniref:cellulase family glycosylhydrolase n=1 Tax=Flavihumibacter sp. CACIAM 22H1 TaxID=1812911 RepID=UPI000A5659DF|nr:cellulase family glycosylhydrolase [Flavihumibacter sp. CACIAM 22H1]
MFRKNLQLQFLTTLLVVAGLFSCNNASEPTAQKPVVNEIRPVWSLEKAANWYSQHKWIVGANFLPSTAINQLEMWQAETFDTATINRELGWASSIGMNTMRVYLHSKAWEQDSSGFLQRMDTYLAIADAHKIKTIFVIFDDVWNKEPKTGKQPDPKPGTHNSGWVQDPGDPYHKDSTLFPALENYVIAVISRFATDKRVLLWDLYNEPGNSGKKNSSLPLLKNVFTWARTVNPDQPLSAGVWDWNFEELNEFQVANSDILTYHNYEAADWHKRVVQLLKMHGRPMICTEYMARTRNSLFSTILPLLKEQQVGAINWGLVAGKSNTIYAWDTPVPDGSEPKLWFHDIFRKDGSPFSKDEIDLIKNLTQ